MSDQAGPHVAVVHNEPVLPPDHPEALSESDVVAMARAVASALESTGFRTTLLAARPPLVGFLNALEALAPDLIFNLVEGFAGRSGAATQVTAVFELLEVPFTGSPSEALAACVSKARAKALLRGFGLPVTASVVVGPGDPVPDPAWDGPTFVKPDAEDGSLGIDQGSVVEDPADLRARVERLRRSHGGPVLIEPYLPGPEFNMGVVAWPDPRALPVARVNYQDRPGKWPILTYDAKWIEGSDEDLATVVECPAAVSAALGEELSALAISAFRATGCRDYARVDFRLDHAGRPMILEVNPNPDLSPGIGIARALGIAGVSYAEGIAGIARQALSRGRSR